MLSLQVSCNLSGCIGKVVASYTQGLGCTYIMYCASGALGVLPCKGGVDGQSIGSTVLTPLSVFILPVVSTPTKSFQLGYFSSMPTGSS